MHDKLHVVVYTISHYCNMKHSVTQKSCNPPSYQIGHTTRKIEEPVKQKSKQGNIHSTPTGLQLVS
jgi:hypothetical protein